MLKLLITKRNANLNKIFHISNWQKRDQRKQIIPSVDEATEISQSLTQKLY